MSPNNRLWTKEKSKKSSLVGSKNQRKASSQVWLEARIKKQAVRIMENQAVKFGWKQGSEKSKQSNLA